MVEMAPARFNSHAGFLMGDYGDGDMMNRAALQEVIEEFVGEVQGAKAITGLFWERPQRPEGWRIPFNPL